jgi:predicted secreted hydrolase
VLIPELGRLMARLFVLVVASALSVATRAAGPLPDVGLFDDGSQGRGFAQVLGPRPCEFPRDHGPHPEYRQEWWYVTGNLDGANGERFGFELTFFRYALAPAANDSAVKQGQGTGAATAAGAVESAWRTRQIYMAHFAVTDVARGRFRFWQKLARGAAVGLAGAKAEPLHVWLDDWSISAAASDETQWFLQAADADYGLSLALQPALRPVLNGDQGFSRKSDEPGSASFYYSIPRIAVRGQLIRDGQPIAVTGLAWLDREWWSGGLSRSEAGWDWFALQLRDGSSFMFYGLREQAGGRNANSTGTWVDSNGRSRSLANNEVQIDVLDYWTNRHGDLYPARWRIRAPVVGLDVTVRPIMADQELTASTHYWEGAVDVTGANANHGMDGRGYVELVGYAAQ